MISPRFDRKGNRTNFRLGCQLSLHQKNQNAEMVCAWQKAKGAHIDYIPNLPSSNLKNRTALL